MRDLRNLIGAVAILLAFGAPGARSADMAQLKPAICGARATCTIAKLTPAGKSDTGAALSVAEVHLGIAEAPDPQFPCHNDEGTANDGGQEYWLVEGSAAPHLLLKLCNDGYGAAGVGMDEITIGDNRFTHFQAGGSNDRWETTETIRLAPQTLLRVDSCDFRGTDPDLVDFTTADLASMDDPLPRHRRCGQGGDRRRGRLRRHEEGYRPAAQAGLRRRHQCPHAQSRPGPDQSGGISRGHGLGRLRRPAECFGGEPGPGLWQGRSRARVPSFASSPSVPRAW